MTSLHFAMMQSENTRIQRWQPDDGDDQLQVGSMGSPPPATAFDDDNVSVLSDGSDDDNSTVTEIMENKSNNPRRNDADVCHRRFLTTKKSTRRSKLFQMFSGRKLQKLKAYEEDCSTASESHESSKSSNGSNGSYFSSQHIKESQKAWKDLKVGYGALMMD